MKIVGLDTIDDEELSRELEEGARFVIYQYCISVLVLTFQRPSSIHFIRSGESAFVRGLGFSMLTFFVGWWGIPWGPIFTIGSLWTNFRGGKDVTGEVLAMWSQGGKQRGD